MEYLFLLGRILYGGYFLKAGINHFRSLAMLSGFAGMKRVPAPRIAVMASGMLIIVGGLSVILGEYPTVGLGCIVLFLVPVSVMMHAFWSDTDPMMKLNNHINFEKNLALAAAALMLMSVPQPWPLSLKEGRVSAAAQQPARAPSPMVKENATIKISDHVYVILDDSVPLVPNVGIIVGSTATMVIDTGLGPRNMQAILRQVAKVSRNADLYLVTTHFHPEHAAGSSALPAGAKFVVSRTQQKDLDELGLSTNAAFASRSPVSAELLKDVQFRTALQRVQHSVAQKTSAH